MNHKIQRSKNITLKWNPEGMLVAETSVSRGEFKVSADVIAFLNLFHQPRRAEDAIKQYLSQHGASDDKKVLTEIRNLVDKLLKKGLLVSDKSRMDALSTQWYANPIWHVNMLCDQIRTKSYRQAIERVARNKVCLEIGCGSGILSFFAVQAGAKKVYAIEESRILPLAMRIAKLNGFDKKIQFIAGNSADVKLPEKVDVFFTELLGTDVTDEKILFYTRDAVKRFVKPGATIIPSKFSIWAIGLESVPMRNLIYRLDYQTRCAQELSRIYGMNLSPLADAYEVAIKNEFYYNTHQAHHGNKLVIQGIQEKVLVLDEFILTQEVKVAEYDAKNLKPESAWKRDLSLPVVRSGKLNAIGMYFKAQMDNYDVLTTSPFCWQTPTNWTGQSWCVLKKELKVQKDTTVQIHAEYSPNHQHGVFFRVT